MLEKGQEKNNAPRLLRRWQFPTLFKPSIVEKTDREKGYEEELSVLTPNKEGSDSPDEWKTPEIEATLPRYFLYYWANTVICFSQLKSSLEQKFSFVLSFLASCLCVQSAGIGKVGQELYILKFSHDLNSEVHTPREIKFKNLFPYEINFERYGKDFSQNKVVSQNRNEVFEEDRGLSPSNRLKTYLFPDSENESFDDIIKTIEDTVHFSSNLDFLIRTPFVPATVICAKQQKTNLIVSDNELEDSQKKIEEKNKLSDYFIYFFWESIVFISYGFSYLFFGLAITYKIVGALLSPIINFPDSFGNSLQFLGLLFLEFKEYASAKSRFESAHLNIEDLMADDAGDLENIWECVVVDENGEEKRKIIDLEKNHYMSSFSKNSKMVVNFLGLIGLTLTIGAIFDPVFVPFSFFALVFFALIEMITAISFTYQIYRLNLRQKEEDNDSSNEYKIAFLTASRNQKAVNAAWLIFTVVSLSFSLFATLPASLSFLTISLSLIVPIKVLICVAVIALYTVYLFRKRVTIESRLEYWNKVSPFDLYGGFFHHSLLAVSRNQRSINIAIFFVLAVALTLFVTCPLPTLGFLTASYVVSLSVQTFMSFGIAILGFTFLRIACNFKQKMNQELRLEGGLELENVNDNGLFTASYSKEKISRGGFFCVPKQSEENEELKGLAQKDEFSKVTSLDIQPPAVRLFDSKTNQFCIDNELSGLSLQNQDQ